MGSLRVRNRFKVSTARAREGGLESSNWQSRKQKSRSGSFRPDFPVQLSAFRLRISACHRRGCREPLILFYREHRSVERVAADLDLSEDAVKQRLLRGRKLLHEAVLALVEGALERTQPGQAFTLGVVAALPALALPASAATVGTAAAKGAAAAKTSLTLGALGALLGPLLGLLGGVAGAWASIHNTKSPRERQFMKRMSLICAGYVAAFLLAQFGLIFLGRRTGATWPVAFGCVITLLVLVYAAGLLEISGNDLNVDALQKAETDPATACRDFWP